MAPVTNAARRTVFGPQTMIRTLKAKSARETAGVNFCIRGMGLDGEISTDMVSAHGVAGLHIGMVVDLPAMSSTGAHGKTACWQAVLATDWAFVGPFGA